MLKLRQRLANMENGEEFAAMLQEALDERRCTNEEDRVLSIMGLLGVKDSQNMKQLRTGKTLKEQLVSVARLMDHDKLIKLVVASSDRPHFFDGMSWAPVLSRDPFAGSPDSTYNRPATRVFDPSVWYQIPGVKHSVRSVEVSVDGLLNLKCKLAHARLIPNPGTTAGHLGTVGAGVTPHLPYCGQGCGRIHVSSHALMQRFLPKQNSRRHLGSLPCSQCCDLASLFVPNLGEFYHAMVQYELQVDARTGLGVQPIHLDAHYFTNAFTMYLRGTMYCDHGEAANIQLPISPSSRHFEQFLMNSFLQQTIPRKVKRCHGPAQYFVPIEVSLLLLGSSCDGKRRVAMVCIGEQHRLHRIGLFNFSAAVGDAIFADTPDTTCSVGSMELDLFLERLFQLQRPELLINI